MVNTSSYNAIRLVKVVAVYVSAFQDVTFMIIKSNSFVTEFGHKLLF